MCDAGAAMRQLWWEITPEVYSLSSYKSQGLPQREWNRSSRRDTPWQCLGSTTSTLHITELLQPKLVKDTRGYSVLSRYMQNDNGTANHRQTSTKVNLLLLVSTLNGMFSIMNRMVFFCNGSHDWFCFFFSFLFSHMPWQHHAQFHAYMCWYAGNRNNFCQKSFDQVHVTSWWIWKYKKKSWSWGVELMCSVASGFWQKLFTKAQYWHLVLFFGR